jgi:hypothetical protein
MSGEPNRPYTITPTKMTLDTRFSGADAAASAVGRNVVQVTPVRPFETEVKRDAAARRIIEPAHHGAGRNPRSTTSYIDYQRGVGSIFSGLVIKSYGTR